MEIFNDARVLERIENNNVPATIQDFQEIAKYADTMVERVSGVIGNVSSTILQIKEISAQVELEKKRMEHAINALMLKAQRDIQIYEKSLPILDKQFERCHDRMDKLMDKSMELITNDVSETSLQRQEAMLTLIEITNNSLNSLIGKLIPRY